MDPNEKNRHFGFKFPQDRRRYAVSRGALRQILARYLGIHPSGVNFGYGPSGKPFLAGSSKENELKFNLSHCDDLVVIAVSCGRDVGVDVEKVREVPEQESIMGRYLSEEDRLFIRATDGHERTRSFFRIWTRREAAAKALGLDISAALTPLLVPTYPPGAGARLAVSRLTVGSSHSLQG